MRLLAVRRRQCSASRNLGTKRIARVLLEQIAELLGIPPGISQGVLLPVAYSIGTDFKQAPRIPLERVVHRNGW